MKVERGTYARPKQPHSARHCRNVRVRDRRHQRDERRIEDCVETDSDETDVEPLVEQRRVCLEIREEGDASDGEKAGNGCCSAVLARLVNVVAGGETSNNVSDRGRKEVSARLRGGSAVDREEELREAVHDTELWLCRVRFVLSEGKEERNEHC